MQNTSKLNTAILLFIRSNKEEAMVKNFGHQLNFQRNRRVVTLLNQHTKKIAKQSGLPTFTIASPQQEGESFGERLGNAFQIIYEKGYDNVIAIGNDCLVLTPQLLEETATQLETQKAVFGPTIDGGVYILGLHKSVFQKTIFQRLSWQTHCLLEALKNHVGEYHELPVLSDANDAKSLRLCLQKLPIRGLIKKQFLLLLEITDTVYFLLKVAFYSTFQKPFLPLRGPPSVFAIPS